MQPTRTQSRIAFGPPRGRARLGLGLAAVLWLAAGAARGVVIDVPSAVIGDAQSIGAGTQLNVYDTGMVGDDFDANDGSEVDVYGGSVGTHFDANSGSVVRIHGGNVGHTFVAHGGSAVEISGGVLGSFFDALSGSMVTITGGVLGAVVDINGGQVDMSDGEIGNDSKVFNGGLLNFSGGMIGSGFVVSGGGVANISGGSILSGFNVLDGGEVNVSGGSIGSGSTVIDGGVVNISGGTLSHRYRGLSGSATHIAGTEFLLDGVPVDGLTLGVPLTILDRDVVLSGVLADGTPFDFALNSVDNFIDDVFETDATVTITLVPEPSAVVLATGALLALVGARFRARSADGSSRCSPRPRRSFPASSHARLCCLPAPR